MTNFQAPHLSFSSTMAGWNWRHKWLSCVAIGLFAALPVTRARGGELLAGVAKVDITNREAGPVNDPLYAKALVLKRDGQTAVIITVDAVAIENIGSFPKDYLARVRQVLQQDLSIPPTSVLVNASHCHGIVCADVTERTIEAVKFAADKLVPVKAGTGTGHEDRIMENRRLRLKSGREADVRHAYRCRPMKKSPASGRSIPRSASCGSTGSMVGRWPSSTTSPAIRSKAFPAARTRRISWGSLPRDRREPGRWCTRAVCAGVRGRCEPGPLQGHRPSPRRGAAGQRNSASARSPRSARSRPGPTRRSKWSTTAWLCREPTWRRIAAVEAEPTRLAGTLRGTSLNLKTFLQLAARHGLASEFPSYDSHRYCTKRPAAATTSPGTTRSTART
jgi:hypothetical protein